MGQPPKEMGKPPRGSPGMGGPGENTEKAEGVIGSWSSGGSEDYEYDAALYVSAEGIDEEKSATDRIAAGEYDASDATGISLSDGQSGDNGIMVVDTDYAITGAEINMLTDADGTDTCDFSGRGSAIAVYGSEANVTIEDSTIHTSGVATMPVFADDGATVTIRNSTLQSDGGTLSADYMNTPDQALMVAPP